MDNIAATRLKTRLLNHITFTRTMCPSGLKKGGGGRDGSSPGKSLYDSTMNGVTIAENIPDFPCSSVSANGEKPLSTYEEKSDIEHPIPFAYQSLVASVGLACISAPDAQKCIRIWRLDLDDNITCLWHL